MNLYDRDYSKLTNSEEAEWEAVRQKEVVNKLGSLEIRKNLFQNYPKAARHFVHLFPNNYLDIIIIDFLPFFKLIIKEYLRRIPCTI